MNIAIVGAGSTGVSTAYALALEGHEVTVYEQRSTVAEEASFGHAGWQTPALLQPWTIFGLDPATRSTALPGRQALLRPGPAWHGDWSERWQRRQAGRRLRKTTDAAPALVALEQLAAHSLQLQQAQWQQWELDPESLRGSLVLLGTEAERERLQPALQALSEAGSTWEPLDATQTRQMEPALGEELEFAGALFFPEGASANGRLATLMQRQAAQAMGVHFEMQHAVTQVHAAAKGRPTQVWLRGQDMPRSHGAIVICTGAEATSLLAPLGLRLPARPLHGYGINAPLREESYAPRHAIVDWSEQLTLTRLGQRIRLAAGAELGRRAPPHEATLQRMYHRLNMLFPGSAALSAGVQVWHGTRLCTTDGLPLLGASGLPGIWLNLGHGGSGAAMAQGCAAVLADLMGQRPTPIDSLLIDPRRFG
ncbi:MAG: FAD-dependent oxidoreductase [Burkholderiaceae bacterium]|jgi:D-amino-acid dehydrogenase|nr:FAD-dependent oxidoreductase [Burkholderiaceae bacterium]